MIRPSFCISVLMLFYPMTRYFEQDFELRFELNFAIFDQFRPFMDLFDINRDFKTNKTE